MKGNQVGDMVSAVFALWAVHLMSTSLSCMHAIVVFKLLNAEVSGR